jgi:aconitase B
MTNIGHFRAAGKVLEGKTDIPTRLWIAPPTKMDAMILNEEGYYAILGKSGARMEMPGCSCAWATRRRSQGQHGDVDLDPQLPQPARHRHPCLSRRRPNWPPSAR